MICYWDTSKLTVCKICIAKALLSGVILLKCYGNLIPPNFLIYIHTHEEEKVDGIKQKAKH